MPIKRHEFLKPLSRDHHQGLLLCWKIKTGLKLQIEPSRIKRYADWFWNSHLQQHFETEEQFIFPLLGNAHKLVKKALIDHQRLKHLFETTEDVPKILTSIKEELEQHIRFEERILFNEIQLVATEDQLKQIQNYHSNEKFEDNLLDPFWEG